MNTIPVIAFKNKAKKDRFLSNGPDAGDWSDDDLDVSVSEIENAFMIWRGDLTKPTDKDVEALKEESKAHKNFMLDQYGTDAVINFDVEQWLEQYEPVNLEITKEQWELAKEWY
ncbi:hypothetical protein [Gracilibacillus sp. YIM 98692]|uniref:hypothetical protein n=1 Tax=Gracilibacillus sp. YIM 98692 TaxID=2663532 RepID=UPI0013D6FDA5|nr:hypothetical protein [Gracilibacillus sp. YIM 98692]